MPFDLPRQIRLTGLVPEFSDLKRNEKPQRVLGDHDTPRLPSSGWPRNKTPTLHTIPAKVCFDYALGCSSSRLGLLCIRIGRVSSIDETSTAQQTFYFLDRFTDHAERLAGLKLVLQLNECLIGCVETSCQGNRNVQVRGWVLQQGGRVGDVPKMTI